MRFAVNYVLQGLDRDSSPLTMRVGLWHDLLGRVITHVSPAHSVHAFFEERDQVGFSIEAETAYRLGKLLTLEVIEAVTSVSDRALPVIRCHSYDDSYVRETYLVEGRVEDYQ